jgi:hypothetical protein
VSTVTWQDSQASAIGDSLKFGDSVPALWFSAAGPGYIQLRWTWGRLPRLIQCWN